MRLEDGAGLLLKLAFQKHRTVCGNKQFYGKG